MRLTYTLCLPRDAVTVPIVRRLLRAAMGELGIAAGCLADVELAVTEASANVIDHAARGDEEYEVTVDLDEEGCHIRVVDTGRGFDVAPLELTTADASAERGRGILLMRALVDCVRFESRPEEGTVVHLYKGLELEEDAPLRQISS